MKNIFNRFKKNTGNSLQNFEVKIKMLKSLSSSETWEFETVVCI